MTTKESKLRVAIIGYTGVIGKAVVSDLEELKNVEVLRVSRQSGGDLQIDIADTKSVSSFFEKVGKLDAVICCCGSAYFGPLSNCTKEKLSLGWKNKLGGQIDLVLQGIQSNNVNSNGVFVLTSGVLSQKPIPNGFGLSMTNAAIDAFVRSAATELPNGIRILAVSPGFVKESNYSADIRKGLEEVGASRVANGYRRALLSGLTGKVIEVTADGSREY